VAGDFGALIRMGRTAQNLILVQARRAMGYSTPTLSRIETGRQHLTNVTENCAARSEPLVALAS